MRRKTKSAFSHSKSRNGPANNVNTTGQAEDSPVRVVCDEVFQAAQAVGHANQRAQRIVVIGLPPQDEPLDAILRGVVRGSECQERHFHIGVGAFFVRASVVSVVPLLPAGKHHAYAGCGGDTEHVVGPFRLKDGAVACIVHEARELDREETKAQARGKQDQDSVGGEDGPGAKQVSAEGEHDQTPIESIRPFQDTGVRHFFLEAHVGAGVGGRARLR
jgi:hypothetical protein